MTTVPVGRTGPPVGRGGGGLGGGRSDRAVARRLRPTVIPNSQQPHHSVLHYLYIGDIKYFFQFIILIILITTWQLTRARRKYRMGSKLLGLIYLAFFTLASIFFVVAVSTKHYLDFYSPLNGDRAHAYAGLWRGCYAFKSITTW